MAQKLLEWDICICRCDTSSCGSVAQLMCGKSLLIRLLSLHRSLSCSALRFEIRSLRRRVIETAFSCGKSPSIVLRFAQDTAAMLPCRHHSDKPSLLVALAKQTYLAVFQIPMSVDSCRNKLCGTHSTVQKQRHHAIIPLRKIALECVLSNNSMDCSAVEIFQAMPLSCLGGWMAAVGSVSSRLT